MTVLVGEGVVTLRETCPVTEAETLLGLLLQHPGIAVDLCAVETVHTAIWQVLLAVRPPIVGPVDHHATDAALKRILVAMLRAPLAGASDRA